MAEAGYRSSLVSLALSYGLTSPPSLQNKEFISDVVFDSSKPAGTPKQRFAYLFPSRDTALVAVRMRPGLSQARAQSHDRRDPRSGRACRSGSSAPKAPATS